MKKFWIVCVAFLAALTLTACGARNSNSTESTNHTNTAHEHTYDENGVCTICQAATTRALQYTLNEDSQTYTVSGVEAGTAVKVIIPSTYEGLPVTSIGKEAFRFTDGITSIVIPNSVTAIEDYAFYGCSDLAGITIPDSVTSIGESAFSSCYDLTSITIPVNVTSIGTSAFAWCSNLTSITVAEGNPVYHAAGNCLIETASKTLIAASQTGVIPADGSVTSIGDYAFCSCDELTDITIPEGITRIGERAFAYCGFSSIIIPDSVTSIGSAAFSGCENLTSIHIPASVTEIDYLQFSHCPALTTITVAAENPVYHAAGNCLIETASKTMVVGCTNSTIPTDGSVTVLGSFSFAFLENLTSVVIPEGVTMIDSFAFSNSTALTRVLIPHSVTELGYQAFSECEQLTSILYEGTTADWAAIVKGEAWNESMPTYTVQCTDGSAS